ncbi:MAG TPA: phage baseplate assembly protein V, partial [Cytophagales bacterium]|nr:phage baseplate assembly protein V [Cytophagales bacterium]
MSKEIKVEINIENDKLSSFSSLHIHQQFNAHHTFELIVDHDALEQTGTHTLQKTQNLIGKFMTVCFGQKETSDNIFKGIITEVGLAQNQGLWGSLVLKGYSPTYLLESGAHYTSFLERKLSDIVKEACSGVASNDLGLENTPKHTEKIPYMCQYGESHFAFLNRLSEDYGEWFFYDGHHLHFGQPNEQPKVDIVYGEHLERMHFSMRLVPSNINHYSYKSLEDELFKSPLPATVNGLDNYSQKAVEISNSLYSSPVQQPVPIRTNSKVELDNYAEKHKERLAAGTVLLSGEGDQPKVKLGCVINVKVSQKGLGVGENEHGSYTVIRLSHQISGTGDYVHSFEAIPAGHKGIPSNVARPVAESQIATVKANDDPDNKGRVKVQMLWQQQKGLTSDWIRVMTPDAGASDKVSTNRGFVFIPEVGDQVIIGFRYNDPNRPFVLGSVFNGKTGAGGGKDNNTKTIITKGGSTIIFDEAKNSITISDPSGNTIA